MNLSDLPKLHYGVEFLDELTLYTEEGIVNRFKVLAEKVGFDFGNVISEDQLANFALRYGIFRPQFTSHYPEVLPEYKYARLNCDDFTCLITNLKGDTLYDPSTGKLLFSVKRLTEDSYTYETGLNVGMDIIPGCFLSPRAALRSFLYNLANLSNLNFDLRYLYFTREK